MTKWADFCIVAVKYGHDCSAITDVEVKPDTGRFLGASRKMSRHAVVTAILRGTTFITAYAEDTEWKKGEDVQVVEIHGEKFIRTDSNADKADNLGKLPRPESEAMALPVSRRKSAGRTAVTGEKPAKPGKYRERSLRGGAGSKPRGVTIEPRDPNLPPTQKAGHSWKRVGPRATCELLRQRPRPTARYAKGAARRHA